MRIATATDGRAVLAGVVVTLLWSSSWVLIKVSIADIPPLTFGGLRYTVAAVFLLAYRSRFRNPIEPSVGRATWASIALLGIVQFSLTQGAQYVALAHLPAQTTSLALSTTPIFVAALGHVVLRERITAAQVAGMLLLILGAALYLFPIPGTGRVATIGIVAVLMAPLVNALALVLGRQANRRLPAVEVTTFSMLIGGVVLLSAGVLTEVSPTVDFRAVAIIGWLSIVNTAFAFTLWNKTLRRLPAATSSAINNTMLVQIGILAWLFLGELMTVTKLIGLLLAAAGALITTLYTSPQP